MSRRDTDKVQMLQNKCLECWRNQMDFFTFCPLPHPLPSKPLQQSNFNLAQFPVLVLTPKGPTVPMGDKPVLGSVT
jgi:hypothetical protein